MDWLSALGLPGWRFFEWLPWLALVLLASLPVVLAEVRPHADIALEVNSAQRLFIRGLVLYRGVPVESGKLQLVVADASTTHHLASVVLDVKQGVFTNEGSSMDGVPRRDLQRELRINAHFWGQARDASGQTVTELDTEKTVYSNCSTPVTRNEVLGFLAGFCLFVLFVISLFTMELTQWRARWLFASSYAATFFSVGFPLFAIVYVSQNPYLIDVMKKSPVGLVRARSQPEGDVQWLLNVGGVVRREPERGPPPPLALGTPAQPHAPGDPASTSTELPATVAMVTRVDGAPSSPARDAAAEPPAAPGEHEGSRETSVVAGGLAIPFYVIILAIFGASINMMRKVPRIHARHMAWLPREIGRAGAGDRSDWDQRRGTDAGCNIRQELIEQHMYLLAAPFLAIAVYYLLQVVAQDVARPVIVLMGFAAGLISERIVSTLIDFAQARLGTEARAGSATRSPQTAQSPGEAKASDGHVYGADVAVESR
jgi:hypothetical protein